MKKKICLLALMITLGCVTLVKAQDEERLKFGAYARAFQENNSLGDEDTLNVDNTSEGETVIDLGMNFYPDKNTEITGLIRFRTELGGFFGAGTEVFLRQLRVKGIIGEVVNYEVGDLYLKMSPYTLYNNIGDGQINEATIFSDLRNDLAQYDNFNRGNYWWQQGAHVDFALDYDDMFIKRTKLDLFFLRNRNSDNVLSIPTTFHAGGKLTVVQSDNFSFAANYINLYESPRTIGDSAATNNPVTSLELMYTLDKDNFTIRGYGEGGFSQLNFNEEAGAPENLIDVFVDAGAGIDLKKLGLSFDAGFRYIGPDFVSSGAQTKRVNFTQTTDVFPVVGNDPFNPLSGTLNGSRPISTFDIIRDPDVYNTQITRGLMAYDPRFGNVMPYGKATPNRTGVVVDVAYADSAETFTVSANTAILSEVQPISSLNYRSFLQVGGKVDINIAQLIGYRKNFRFNVGYRFEQTSRAGTVGVDFVDLATQMVDVGIDFEIVKKLDILLGAKMVLSDGNEFLDVRDGFNQVTGSPIAFTTDGTEMLLGAGLKYRFTRDVYLTVQNHFLQVDESANNVDSYSINQLLIWFNMNF